MFGSKKAEEVKQVWGPRCSDCGKAMFFFCNPPIFGAPIHSDNVYVRPGFNKPVNGHGVTCQYCGVHWIKISFSKGMIRQFDEATGEEIKA